MSNNTLLWQILLAITDPVCVPLIVLPAMIIVMLLAEIGPGILIIGAIMFIVWMFALLVQMLTHYLHKNSDPEEIRDFLNKARDV
jgi:hypothetical protein